MSIGEVIKQEVQRRGWSIRETSIRAGIVYSPVHGFLTGKRDIRLLTAEKLCDALGLELKRKRGARK